MNDRRALWQLDLKLAWRLRIFHPEPCQPCQLRQTQAVCAEWVDGLL